MEKSKKRAYFQTYYELANKLHEVEDKTERLKAQSKDFEKSLKTHKGTRKLR